MLIISSIWTSAPKPGGGFAFASESSSTTFGAHHTEYKLSSACSTRMVSLLFTIVGTILFAGVFAALFLFPHRSKGPKKAPAVSTSQNKKHQQLFTLAEVSKHNTADDCWIIVKNKVYNVTPYVEEHPGGYAILNHAGGDSTEGFYGPQHASRVFDMVDEFYIGEVTS